MEKRRLGHTDLAIAPLVLGGNVFGWTAERDTSFKLLDRFVDAGFQAIDTADVYSVWVPAHQGGESESIIGEWMQSRGNRDRVVLITKVGWAMDTAGRGLSAARIERDVEASLRRLRTDRIDLYFSHVFDPQVPQEETLGAYERLIRAGKVRYIGASNHTADQLALALQASAARNLPRYQVLQPEYNLCDRSAFEGALRDKAVAAGLGVITYFSLASGFLTGKYRSKSDFSKSPRGGGMARYLDARGLAILAALDQVAAAHGAKPAEVALAWLMASKGVTAPIASATRIEQLESLLRATQLQLSAAEMAALDRAGA
jgi:aryl-alcohol dehydrogenase-like predicted oxidoreductase